MEIVETRQVRDALRMAQSVMDSLETGPIGQLVGESGTGKTRAGKALVERLENGELSLEDSLTAFEQGIGLTRDCQSALAQAEQKVQVLLERDGELAEEPFDAEQPE